MTEKIIKVENGHSSSKDEDLRKEVWFDIVEHISTVAHVFIIGIGVVFIYLCFIRDFTLMSWHVLLSTFGWIIFMAEGILAVTRHNVVSKRLQHDSKIRLHWIFEAVAVLLTLAGFIIVIIDREDSNVTHFQTDHGLFGLLGMIFSIIVCFNGITALYSHPLRNIMKPNLNKLFHIFTGILAFVFGVVSLLVLFQYSNRWFAARTEDNEHFRLFCFWTLLLSFVWTLIAPAISCLDRLKSMF